MYIVTATRRDDGAVFQFPPLQIRPTGLVEAWEAYFGSSLWFSIVEARA